MPLRSGARAPDEGGPSQAASALQVKVDTVRVVTPALVARGRLCDSSRLGDSFFACVLHQAVPRRVARRPNSREQGEVSPYTATIDVCRRATRTDPEEGPQT